MVEQRVHQGAAGVARPGVHHPSGGLVHHQEVPVLVEHRQRERLGQRRGRSRNGHGERHRLSPPDPQGGAARAAVDRHPALGEQLLDSGAAQLGEGQCQRTIQPRPPCVVPEAEVVLGVLLAHQIFERTCALPRTMMSTTARSKKFMVV